MTHRCSHCSHNGHNSRTCPNRGVKLFGVRLTDGSIRKSASMGNLSPYFGSNSGMHNGNGSGSPCGGPDHADGYASEDFVPGSSSSRERKRGVPWTEEEHRMFLLGLQKLGKGDWRGISRNYVISRTPTQVASHAQKYFIRQCNVSRGKRRSSLFDIVADEDLFLENPPQPETQSPALDEEGESMDANNSNDNVNIPPKPDTSQPCHPALYPAYFLPFSPFSLPYRMGQNTEQTKDTHQVIKPMAVHSKSPINVKQLVGLSKLRLGESIGDSGTSSLSLKLNGSSRASAFHVNPSPGKSSMNSSGSPIHAV
ncbi:transcription factor MYBS3-like isoform X2 [Hibiscus syriacus]|uniref:transcription factor MYBS3-like isoform X2 n=1 Tax=Hibiscus syriacus TaxID=106335 RepID=UPI0019247931|nr:transcription factor MYBS3-like isoform X2 [Hibiscus syriacus]